MLLDERDGILCDTCGKEYRKDFTYYSIEGEMIMVRENIPATHNMGKVVDFDMCKECHNKMVERCMDHLNPNPHIIQCEQCGTRYKGEFNYIWFIFSKVTVTTPINKDPETDEVVYNVEVDKKVLDLKLDSKCYNEISAKVKEHRNDYAATLAREATVRSTGSEDRP